MTDDTEMRLLVLLRHAQAKGHSPQGDAERELTASGRRVAQEVGAWLVQQGVRPDVVVTSPSTRTVQTWENLRAGGLSARDVWADAAIYDADAADVVESINAVPDDVRTLVVVGHAPAIPEVAMSLPDHLPQGSESTPQGGWPPAAVAVVGHRGPWAHFPGPESALVAFRVPGHDAPRS